MAPKQQLCKLIVGLMALRILASAFSTAAQTVDSSFTNDANSTIFTMAVQPDRKALAAGNFSAIGGQSFARIARINFDGTLDPSFNPGANDFVYSLAVQLDGKILAGGLFTQLGGQTNKSIGRINKDGTMDTTFTAQTDGSVMSILLQPDGKILVSGAFTNLNNQNHRCLGRLNADSSLDADFAPSANDTVYAACLQPDGKILIGGAFTNVNGQPRSRIARLNQDGSLDSSFNSQPDNTVFCLSVQREGKIWVGGSFTNLNGELCNRIARLNQDGTRDISFNTSANAEIYTFSQQADGKMLVGGNFTQLGSQTRNRIGRIESNGDVDDFYPTNGANGTVFSIIPQADDTFWISGNFSQLGGQSRRYIGRLNSAEAAYNNLGFDGTNINWILGGTSPEFRQTIFYGSTNGTEWMGFGQGLPVPGGWQLQVTNAGFPLNGYLRAHGYFVSGRQNGSGSWNETFGGPPLISIQPSNQINNFGDNAVFRISTGGTLPLSHQWYKDGMILTNDQSFETASATLTLSNVFGANYGEYFVVVSNAFGSVTSSIVSLTVVDPLIVTNPIGQSLLLGQDATFSVSVTGTPPFAYQWRKNGTNLADATTTSISLTNMQVSDAAAYDVAVSNQFRVTVSRPAILTYNLATVDSLNLSANLEVNALAIQPDGKILAGGLFGGFGGATRFQLARVNTNGTVDTGFSPTAVSPVYSLNVQEDGKIIVAGKISSLAGSPRGFIGRLNTNGTLDTAFNPAASMVNGTDHGIFGIALQPDGKILVAGNFRTIAGQTRTNIARLNPNGTLDTNFNASANSVIYPLALQPDGKILVGGDFTDLCGQARHRIGRLNSDGSLDSAFNPGIDNLPICFAVQTDGKIIVGGTFTRLGGQPRANIGRLNPDGSIDPSFTPGASSVVRSIVLQADGKIIVSGNFTNLGGALRPGIGRLFPNGSVDPFFGASATPGITYSLAIQRDGKVLLGGTFTSVDGIARQRFARLNNTDPALNNLMFTNSTLLWERGGTAPEAWRTSFDSSTNGTNWTSLGSGQRTEAGWQLNGINFSTTTTVRARAFFTGGRYNISGWFEEKLLQVAPPPPLPPIITINDGLFGFQSNRFGFSISNNSNPIIVLEGSSNLSHWISLQTNTNGTPFYFSDPESEIFPQRFYRLRRP